MLLVLSLAAAAERVVSADEVARHGTFGDCWLAIDGGVYDVSSFILAHPGGPVIGGACGKDASALFHNRPESGTDHSDAARAILPSLRVGRLEGGQARSRREEFASRARAGTVAGVPTANLPPSRHLRVDLGHELGEDNNVRIGFAYGVSDKVAIELVHATFNGESDVGATVAHGTATIRGGLHAGVGYRYKGVPEGDNLGVYAELPFQAALVREWLSLNVTPGVAILPKSSGELARVGGGFGLTVRPWPVASFFGEARMNLGSPRMDWSGGVRFHTSGHTFGAWAGSSYAMTPLDRLAPGKDAIFAVGFSLTRDFQLGKPRP